jgi:hypothetical protein
MANPIALHGFSPYKCLGGGVFDIEEIDTTSNTTVIAGQAITLNSSGCAIVAAAASCGVYGVATHAITGAAGVRKKLKLIPAMSNYVFSARSKPTINCTVGNMGQVRAMVMSGAYHGVATDSTASVVQIIGKTPDSAWGTCVDLLVVFRKPHRLGQH